MCSLAPATFLSLLLPVIVAEHASTRSWSCNVPCESMNAILVKLSLLSIPPRRVRLRLRAADARTPHDIERVR